MHARFADADVIFLRQCLPTLGIIRADSRSRHPNIGLAFYHLCYSWSIGDDGIRVPSMSRDDHDVLETSTGKAGAVIGEQRVEILDV